MNFRRTKAVFKKEFIQIWRDPRSLALAFAIPILLLVLFGYALSLDIDHIPMAVWNQDGSVTAREFLLNFKNSKYFKIIGYYDNYPAMEYLLDRGDAMMAMVIPKDFSKYIQSNGIAPLQVIIDGSDSNTAQTALGYVGSVVYNYNMGYVKNALAAQSIENSDPVDMRSRIWFNQDLDSKLFIVPGLIAIIMMIIAALLTSLTIAREWERGTMEQLISTPVRGIELIIGKFTPYFVIGLIDLIISVIMGILLFNVPLRGNVVLLFVCSGIFLTGALMLGIYISVVAKSQLMASQMAILTSFLPTFMLSGFTYEIFNMPDWVQNITYLVPARYFIVILRGIYLKGVGIEALWINILALSIFSLIAVRLAIMKFKKKVA
ncbi:MAG: ABC transporter permease [Candidatus Omnitrophota bacterium]|nr:ABC transporter permease [Candidatus Omnitrophota bacterium]